MKQTKIGWLMAFLLFSGFLLRGQGWRRFYDNDSTSTTMFDAIPSKTGGYLLNVGTANGQPYGVIKTDFEGRVIRTIRPKTVNHSGKLIELSDTTFVIVYDSATVTKYNMRGDSLGNGLCGNPLLPILGV